MKTLLRHFMPVKAQLFVACMAMSISITSSLFSQSMGNSLQFDGSGDYVTLNALAPALSAGSNYTIEFWMKADLNNNTGFARVNLFAINPVAPGDNKFAILMGGTGGTQTGKLIIYEAAGAGTMTPSSTTIGDNNCHHIAYVRSGGSAEAFIDGVSMGTMSVGTAWASNDRISLGQEWDNTTPSDYYNGNIDELRIWNVAKSASEIQANMNLPMAGTETNLIAYYNFNQGIAGGSNGSVTTLDDLTANNYNGALQGFAYSGTSSNWVSAACMNSNIQNALDFDGVDDYVTLNALASPLASATDFTIEFWMKADLNDNLGFARVNMFAINPAVPNDNKFAIIMGGTGGTQTGHLIIYEAGTGILTPSSTVIGDNMCHHIAYVRTGSTGEAFIDGVSIGTMAVGTALAGTDRISLGQEWDNAATSDFYDGNMDELLVWNVAKSQAQIQADMHTALTGSESGLIGYYNFDQGIPGGVNTGINTLNDLTANNYDGNLTLFALSGNSSNWVQAACSGNALNALNFSQSNSDYVEINSLATPLASSGDFTVEFWMRANFNTNTAARTNFFAINPAASGTDQNKFAIALGSATTQTGHLVIYEAAGMSPYLVSPGVIGDNRCHHIAYVRSGSNGEAFVDGISIGTIAVSAAIASNDRVSLGQEWDNTTPSDFYNGNMDEVRVWNVARSLADIQANMYNSLVGNEAGLIAYYNCDQGISGGNNTGISTLSDLAGANNNGNLNNFLRNGSVSNFVLEDCKDSSNNELNFSENSSDYVVLDALAGPLSDLTDFTIEFWMQADFNTNTAPRTNFFAINPAVSGVDQNRFAIVLGSATTQTGHLVIYEAAGMSPYLVSPGVIGDDRCHHIAYVRTGNSGEAFVDGVSIGTIAVSSAILGTDRISLGQEWDNNTPSDFYNGDMDELKIWGVARTTLQIQSDMNSPLIGNETGLLAYYNFNQGVSGGNNTSITTLNDLTPGNFDGTLAGFTLTGSTSNFVIEECISYDRLAEPSAEKEQHMSDVPEIKAETLIFPNPSQGTITIQNTGINGGQVMITDLSGRVIYTGTLNQVLNVDLSNMAVGMYQLTIVSEGIISTYKIMKN